MSPVHLLGVHICIALVAARAAGAAFRRAGQPRLVGEMVAGILLVPWLLTWVAPQLSAALRPGGHFAALEQVGQLGLLVFVLLGAHDFFAGRRGRGMSAIACSLFVIAGTASRAGGAKTAFAVTVGGGIAYIAFTALVAPRALQRIGAQYATKGKMSEQMIAAIVLLLVAAAWVARHAGLHAAFGAVEVAAIMPSDGAFVRQATRSLRELSEVLLLPIFFVCTGLRTHTALHHVALARPLVAFVAIVTTASTVGCGVVVGRFQRVSTHELRAPRLPAYASCLAGLVALTIGAQLGIVSAEPFAIMALAAVVIAALSTPILLAVGSRNY